MDRKYGDDDEKGPTPGSGGRGVGMQTEPSGEGAASPVEKVLGPNDNLWQDFLANKSGATPEMGHLVVLGSAGSGKTSLVGQFGRLEAKFGDMKQFLIMRYSYMYLSDQDSQSTKLVNIWQISEPEHCAVVKEVVPSNEMERFAWMIVLDASKPHIAKEEFDKWMKVLLSTQEELLTRVDPRVQARMKENLMKHIQFYVNPNDTEAVEVAEEDKEIIELNRENPKENTGVPIVVVLTKVDAIKNLYPAEAQANAYYDILCQYIRMWSLDTGAAVFSMAGGLKEQARRLVSYLDHRIFGVPFERGPSAVVSVTDLQKDFLFIPTGFDSMSIIESQAGKRSLEDPFEQYFKQPAEEKKEEKRDYSVQADEDNTFLKKVAWDLERAMEQKGKGGGRGTSSTVTSGATISDSSSGKKGDQEAVQKFFNRLLQNSGNPG